MGFLTDTPPHPLFWVCLQGAAPKKNFFSFQNKDMARKGRPRKGSPYRWNRARVQALEKRLKDLQAKIDSGEIKVTYPTKEAQDEAKKAFTAKAKKIVVEVFKNMSAENVAVLKGLKASTMPLSDMVMAASTTKPVEAPKDLIGQICQSREMKALLMKYPLAKMADSDEGRALAKAFPVVGRIWDAIKATNEKRLKDIKAVCKFHNFLNGYDYKDMPSITTLVSFINAPTRAFAEALQEAQNQPPKSLNPKVTMQDIDAVYDILIKYDIFVSKPTKTELLAAIRAKAQKPLRIENIRLWTYFLDGLFEKNLISGNWMDAYGIAQAFENSGGKLLTRDDFSKYLATNDKGRWDEKRDSKIKPKARERMNFYKDIDEALSSL